MVSLRFGFIIFVLFLYCVLSSNVYLRVFSLRYLRVYRYRFAFIVASPVLFLRVFVVFFSLIALRLRFLCG
jgi:hypothetical protein